MPRVKTVFIVFLIWRTLLEIWQRTFMLHFDNEFPPSFVPAPVEDWIERAQKVNMVEEMSKHSSKVLTQLCQLLLAIFMVKIMNLKIEGFRKKLTSQFGQKEVSLKLKTRKLWQLKRLEPLKGYYGFAFGTIKYALSISGLSRIPPMSNSRV